MAFRQKHYLQQSYLLPEELEDAAAALVAAEGCLGVESHGADEGQIRLEVYFPGGEERGLLLPFPAAHFLGESCREEQDWLEPWRQGAQPVAVGERFLLDPREPEEIGEGEGIGGLAAEGRFLLRLPARRAFGTGSHESTRLVVEHLEGMDLRGQRVLDVGSGTGVLAFAALRLGAAAAVATEIDLTAALVAGENRSLNNLHPTFLAAPLKALRPQGDFDVALVNIIPELILPEIALLPPLLKPGCETVFSGILAERGEWFLEQVEPHGFTPIAVRHAAEWVSYRCRFQPWDSHQDSGVDR